MNLGKIWELKIHRKYCNDIKKYIWLLIYWVYILPSPTFYIKKMYVCICIYVRLQIHMFPTVMLCYIHFTDFQVSS